MEALKKINKISLIVALAIPLALGLFGRNTYAATTPSLGTVAGFGILANNFTYANSGSTITGNLGYATTSGTGGFPAVSGSTNVANGAYTQAGSDQGTLLSALNSQPCTVNLPASVDLALHNSGVYTPGVYCTPAFSTATIGAAGITLSGSGTYIFRINSTLRTATSSQVNLTNGASACDVFWTTKAGVVVSQLGSYSKFVGTLIVDDSSGLIIKDHLTMTGRALVFGGSVSIAEKDTITVPSSCTIPPATATLHVIKVFYNDYGGNAVPFDATIHVKNGGVDVAGSPQSGAVSPGTTYTLSPGTYTVSEDAFPGYSAIYGNDDCDYGGNVTLAPGDDKTCTVSNDENPHSVVPATLHVIKKVINDDGGTAVASSFSLHVKGASSFGTADVAGSPASGVGTPGRSYTLAPGAYAVSEDFFTGYSSTFSGDCDSSGHVTLGSSDNKTCTITNDDDQVPSTSDYPATLHVIKVVINDNGGTAVVSDAMIHVKNGMGEVSGSPHAGASGPGGTTYVLNPGTYAVSENAMPGYTSSFSGDCDSSGNVTLAHSDNKKCTITNNDGEKPSPKIKTATLHVVKVVINDNGGIAVPASFSLNVKKGVKHVVGSPAAGTSAPGTLYTLKAGTYKVSEKALSGYAQSFSGDCDKKGKVKLKLGDDKTCTITNDDTDKKSPPKIHVDKLASPLDLPRGGGMVSYSYTVTNPGTIPLSNVTLTDDKCSPILGPSGDTNKNKQLDLTEKWKYTCTTLITHTTRNTVVATGMGGGATVSDTDEEKVFVKTPGFPDTAATSNGLPVRVKIPTIKVNAPIHPIGLTPEGDMGKPSGPGDVVWYKLGTLPGEIGTAVIAGHFGRWLNGSGSVFDRLHELKLGDKLTLEDDNGVVTTYVVRASQLYDPKDDTTDIFDSDDGLSHLNIITCSGTFNPKTKSFPKRLVVFTDKVTE